MRNGQAFYVDMRSTNGSQLNKYVYKTILIPITFIFLKSWKWYIYSKDLEALVPYRLQHGDVLVMGSTELKVCIAEDENDENQENNPAKA